VKRIKNFRTFQFPVLYHESCSTQALWPEQGKRYGLTVTGFLLALLLLSGPDVAGTGLFGNQARVRYIAMLG
jgi:hypothetical protein